MMEETNNNNNNSNNAKERSELYTTAKHQTTWEKKEDKDAAISYTTWKVRETGEQKHVSEHNLLRDSLMRYLGYFFDKVQLIKTKRRAANSF
jgi:hypothetical protein